MRGGETGEVQTDNRMIPLQVFLDDPQGALEVRDGLRRLEVGLEMREGQERQAPGLKAVMRAGGMFEDRHGTLDGRSELVALALGAIGRGQCAESVREPDVERSERLRDRDGVLQQGLRLRIQPPLQSFCRAADLPHPGGGRHR